MVGDEAPPSQEPQRAESCVCYKLTVTHVLAPLHPSSQSDCNECHTALLRVFYNKQSPSSQYHPPTRIQHLC